MYLKKVEMRGFKTFADRTEMEFGPGITAVVGPNGVGKSNVSDAILWALGEQSNRTLRTQASQDVIFAGSEKRRPIGMAEVALTIDNADNALPVEFSEIIVARRLFRSGDSEYLVNRATARLRDIRDMLLDTGVGPDAYSVIGQGEIDAILSIRSEDRRELLEEVAGIRKYRVRRDEATRKLQATEDNVTRVADILAELTAHREPLEKEAELARHYNELSDRLRQLELHLLAGDYRRRRNRVGKLTNDLAVTQADLQTTRNQLSGLESEYERVQLDLARAADEVDALRDQAGAAERELDQALQAQALARERIRAAVARQEDLNVALEGHTARAQELSRQLETVDAELEAATLEFTRAQEERATLEAQLKDRSAEFESKADKIRQLEQTQAEILKRASALENEALALHSLENDLAERAERLSRQSEAITQRELESRDALAAAQARREELKVSSQRKSEELAELRRSLARAGRTLQEHRHKCNVFSGAVTGAEARQELLTELERSREGFSDGVRAALQASAQGHIAGVQGIVADLLDVPARFGRAIEAALGDTLQWVVVDTEEHAAAAAEYVRGAHTGRVTFVPVSAFAGLLEPATVEHISGPGCMGLAVKSIRTKKEYAKLFESLLGNTFIVRDLQAAVALRQQTRTRAQLVTLAGETIRTDGAISVGGEEGAGAQAFVRRRELETISRELETMRTCLADMWRREENLDQWCTRLTDDIHTVEAELSGLNSSCATAESDAAHLADQQKAARQAGLELSEEAKGLHERLQSAQNRRQAAAQEGEELREQAEQTGTQIEAARAAGVSQAEVDQYRARQVNAQVHTAELAEKKRSLQHLKERYTAELQRARQETDARGEELQLAREAEAQLREQLATPDGQLAQMQERAKASRAAVEHGADQLSSLRERSAALEASRRRLTQVTQDQTDRTHRAELAIAREEAQIEGIVQRLQDTYGMTPEEAFDERDEEAGERAIREEANKLREQIRKLGPVNISAIDECERLRAREEFLAGQLDDLDQAKQDLLQVIKEIDDVATSEFMTCFEMMQEQFQVMFARLFDGGETQLTLTDQDKPLESGVDVIVQVPGKRQQNLLLLSGGERALTAMALIFAMLRVRPSPFCLMDEIDAALDEANVGRFVDLLREFALESQFIIITHNPHTIQAADVLFGVTMEDAGVSQLIRLELREWEEFMTDAEEKVATVTRPHVGSRVLPTQT